MMKDMCILVDGKDQVVGSASKKDCHVFSHHQPEGILHRAFSVFLFNSKNQLLLQQRAASKITFPNVWTNTCCSHPLYGQHPDELDSVESIAKGQVPGVKHAAVRKLHHELGIEPQEVPLDEFKYLTRVHYCAPSTLAGGEHSGWGEHEVDYILFIQKDLKVAPNPEEVQDYRYVDLEELKAMMHEDSGLQWSPWFKIIVNHFLEKWWSDLPKTLRTQEHCDFEVVHQLTCD